MRFDTFFSSTGIEYYAVADIKNVRLTKGELLEREDFVPRSVILFLVPYYTLTPKNISRYAASYDYHLIIRKIGEGLSEALKADFPLAKMKIYGDHSPIDERSAALTHGLGILGDNGLLINEKYGSYIFIGDMICDIPPEKLGARETGEVRYCMHCGACKRSCPTGILRGESDACLSAITQRKGELEEWEKECMRRYNTAWGCDLCQSACPYNKNPEKTPVRMFYEDVIEELTSEGLSRMNKEDFQRRAFSWRGRKVVERNLEILEK